MPSRQPQTPASPPSRKLLPIGIQTFRALREAGCYYVDKTRFIGRMASRGKHYFLSRPRRFGKSLLLDTIGELFAGNEALFRDLAVHRDWDWQTRHPVLRLDFARGDFSDPTYLADNVAAQLDRLERQANAPARYHTAPERLADLIERLSERENPVVVLVDEYDKPILDALDAPQVAMRNRNYLRGLYGTLKSVEAHVRLSLLTGVSKFSKVSLFSGLNNLTDITVDTRYAEVCGYTEAELSCVFGAELPGIDHAEMRRWYNGYNWRGESVYNPYDVLLLFDKREFADYWFETGTPTFLIDTLLRHNVSAVRLENALSSADLLADFDVDNILPEALLFQTGYLTIGDVERRGRTTFYRLTYPNHEVRHALTGALLTRLTTEPSQAPAQRARLYDLLLANDFPSLYDFLKSFFAGIPYQWHTRNNIADYEGYYASVFYALFAAQDMDVTVEDSSSRGRLDMAVAFNNNLYLFEFKVVAADPEGAAMAQLKGRGYADKYRATKLPIHLIGVQFSKQVRNVVGFDVQPLPATQPSAP